MKILIITQKVDSNDPILGFFHRWIEEFSAHCERVTVIGQLVGKHALPDNVSVYSLGKERGVHQLVQIFHFWKLQWALRKEYDVVLVHMTPIWIVLGALSWLILKKPMHLWYEAKGGGIWLPLSFLCIRKVFSASSSSVATRSKKSVIMGHGIDITCFAPQGDREEGLLVTVSRITRSKHLEEILECLPQLPEEFHLVIAGTPITSADQEYLSEIQAFIDQHNLGGRVNISAMTQDEVAFLLKRAEYFLHASTTGLDKAVLEAMASGCLVISSGVASTAALPSQCLCEQGQLLRRVQEIAALTSEEKQKLRSELRHRIESSHSLDHLIERLCEELQ